MYGSPETKRQPHGSEQSPAGQMGEGGFVGHEPQLVPFDAPQHWMAPEQPIHYDQGRLSVQNSMRERVPMTVANHQTTDFRTHEERINAVIAAIEAAEVDQHEEEGNENATSEGSQGGNAQAGVNHRLAALRFRHVNPTVSYRSQQMDPQTQPDLLTPLPVTYRTQPQQVTHRVIPVWESTLNPTAPEFIPRAQAQHTFDHDPQQLAWSIHPEHSMQAQQPSSEYPRSDHNVQAQQQVRELVSYNLNPAAADHLLVSYMHPMAQDTGMSPYHDTNMQQATFQQQHMQNGGGMGRGGSDGFYHGQGGRQGYRRGRRGRRGGASPRGGFM